VRLSEELAAVVATLGGRGELTASNRAAQAVIECLEKCPAKAH